MNQFRLHKVGFNLQVMEKLQIFVFQINNQTAESSGVDVATLAISYTTKPFPIPSF